MGGSDSGAWYQTGCALPAGSPLACATQNPARPLRGRPGPPLPHTSTKATFVAGSLAFPRTATANHCGRQLASADAFKDPARMLRFDEAWAALEEALTSATNSDLESQMAADVSGLHEAWKASVHIAAFSVGIGRRRR